MAGSAGAVNGSIIYGNKGDDTITLSMDKTRVLVLRTPPSRVVKVLPPDQQRLRPLVVPVSSPIRTSASRLSVRWTLCSSVQLPSLQVEQLRPLYPARSVLPLTLVPSASLPVLVSVVRCQHPLATSSSADSLTTTSQLVLMPSTPATPRLVLLLSSQRTTTLASCSFRVVLPTSWRSLLPRTTSLLVKQTSLSPVMSSVSAKADPNLCPLSPPHGGVFLSFFFDEVCSQLSSSYSPPSRGGVCRPSFLTKSDIHCRPLSPPPPQGVFFVLLFDEV